MTLAISSLLTGQKLNHSNLVISTGISVSLFFCEVLKLTLAAKHHLIMDVSLLISGYLKVLPSLQVRKVDVDLFDVFMC